jgi:hypothetical protein
MDIVFIEKAAEMVPPSIQGAVIAGERVEVDGAHSTLTYDDLVEKIFSSDRVIVL